MPLRIHETARKTHRTIKKRVLHKPVGTIWKIEILIEVIKLMTPHEKKA